MSTRAVIARKTARGWTGRYHHNSGSPTDLGAELWRQVREEFKGDLGAMLSVLIDKHPAGWSSILGAKWEHAPGYTEDRHELRKKGRKRWGSIQKRAYRAQCFCHGDRKEEGYSFTKSQPNGDIEWAYVIDEAARTLTVLHGVGGKLNWFSCGTFALEGAEPAWEDVEYLPCRTNQEWCHHYKWVHDKTICRTCDGTRIQATSGHSTGFSLQQDHSDCVPVERLQEPVGSIYRSLPKLPQKNWHCYNPRLCEACGGTGKAVPAATQAV